MVSNRSMMIGQWMRSDHNDWHATVVCRVESDRVESDRVESPNSSAHMSRCRFVHVDSVSNLADFLTKPLGAVAFWRVVKPVLFKSVTRAERNEKTSNEHG